MGLNCLTLFFFREKQLLSAALSASITISYNRRERRSDLLGLLYLDNMTRGPSFLILGEWAWETISQHADFALTSVVSPPSPATSPFLSFDFPLVRYILLWGTTLYRCFPFIKGVERGLVECYGKPEVTLKLAASPGTKARDINLPHSPLS